MENVSKKLFAKKKEVKKVILNLAVMILEKSFIKMLISKSDHSIEIREARLSVFARGSQFFHEEHMI